MNKEEEKGSRPSPSNRLSTSSLSLFFIIGLAVIAAFIASGSIIPVDPNGPGGPPTLEPYYNSSDYPVQNVITPTGGFSSQKNLQLETFQVDNCGENTAILFVVDTSGSMAFAGKMDNTKKALRYFTTNMGGKSVVGIETFSKEVKDEVPLAYYKDVKTQVTKVIDQMKPDGWTRTKDAMQEAYATLKQSIDQEDYPNYKYNLVLMTDGVPEVPPDQPRTCYKTYPDPNTAPALRCFAKEQDPTVPTDISAKIKNLGVDIYTINVYSPSYPSDAFFFTYLQTLLQSIASSPMNTHYYVSTNASNLSQILQNIDSSICYKNFN